MLSQGATDGARNRPDVTVQALEGHIEYLTTQLAQARLECDQARCCARVHRRALVNGDLAALTVCQARIALPDWLIDGIG